MQGGSIFVSDIDSDFNRLDEIFGKDYSNRWRADSAEKPDYKELERLSSHEYLLSLNGSIGVDPTLVG
ncbi:MAG: hypothetical protein ACKO3V_04120 [Pirellula sp.]